MDKGGAVEYSTEEGVQYGLVWRRHNLNMNEGVQYRFFIISVWMRVCSTNHSHFISFYLRSPEFESKSLT